MENRKKNRRKWRTTSGDPIFKSQDFKEETIVKIKRREQS